MLSSLIKEHKMVRAGNYLVNHGMVIFGTGGRVHRMGILHVLDGVRHRQSQLAGIGSPKRNAWVLLGVNR